MSITVSPPPVAPAFEPLPPEHAHPPAAGARGVGTVPPSPRWVVPALIALLSVTAAAYLWDLSLSGYANSFYAAAVQAGTKSWKAFFFGSIDSSNFITVDKSPGSLWVMELSGRLFGFNTWSMLVPQVLEGVAAVGLVFAAVRRWFGPVAGLVAGAALATTPVAALMFRFNNPDALMVLLSVAAASTLIRALEKAGTRWIVVTGALIGFAFLAKMLQAFTVLPAFAGVYLLAAPTGLWRRVRQLALMGVAVVVSAGWWVAAVALWPVASRPMIDGSPDNSILNLIFGYNGLSRLSGGSGGNGTGFSGATGILRLFNDLMGGQASWLLPAALLALVAGLVLRGRAPRTDRTRAALLLWGGWLLVTGAVFSFSKGVIHTYYTVALAPAIAALVGMGAGMLWQNRHRMAARAVGAVAVAVSAVWAFSLLQRTPAYVPWLHPFVLVSGVLAAAALVAAPALPALTGRITVGALGLGLVAALSGPIAYSATTLTTAHTGSIPAAGPTVGGGGPGGGPGAGGGSGGLPGGVATSGRFPTATGGSPPGAGGLGGTPPTGAGGRAPSGSTQPTAGTGAFGGGPTGSAAGSTSGLAGGERAGGGRAAGGAVGRPGGATAGAALTSALRSDAAAYRWVAATFGSQSAATLELAADEPVMAIGGFNGQGGNISLATFEAYVAKGEIHYFISSGSAGGGAPGGGGGANSDAAITSWVEAHFTTRSIGGQTVYDLTSPK
ncbi:MAG: glycosyltransferase family 39 protein [Acidimicrobiales bacterium]